MDQYIGRLLDNRYEILEVLGTGGMAVVYKARCHRLNRLVAIKILKDEFAMDEEFRRRFHAEGEAVAMLSHPNIVQVYDVSTSDSANYIVMELIDGISLKQYMEKKGVLNWKETLHFSMQIAKALEHAHSRGIVHRDIKPHNVMVLKNGSVKVMDFGIARMMNKSNTLTKEALGSVHYISPEQAKGGHTDNRSDIYSLSVVMYEMMTGRPPYDGESAVSVAIQHINGGAPAPSTLNPNIPVGLEQIIMKGMALDIRDRYVSATEMLQEMEEFRKNPNIVFQHHFLVDDATRALPNSQPRTVAERKAQAKGGTVTTDSIRLHQPAAPPRRATGSIPVSVDNETIRRAQQRRKAEVRKKEEERSRVATTAIVICSGVAVVAIIIFLVALFNGRLLNQERSYVDVPYLEGKMYSEKLRLEYPDFTFREMPRQYSDTHPEGQILSQQPAGGGRVQRGTDLWLTISMGPEPEKRVMDNFVGADANEACNLLTSQGLAPLPKRESSYVFEEGTVIRTDPASGAEVSQGQTVYVYVSTGPDVKTAPMPNTVGVSLDRVKEQMELLGFQNVRYEQVESQRPKNEVVYQSVAKGKETDVASEIIIHYSQGPQQATEATTATAPTEETQAEIMLSIPWEVPERPVEYLLEVCMSGSKVVLASKLVPPNTNRTYLDLSGSGVQYYDLYIDGEFDSTKMVDYTVKGSGNE